ncbi:GntR family transcriptional regulator [Pseudonocardia alni]|uniref:GntR family transcriptional regulator n=1 Tax=Pseudonocardia alni TaxID=33907 RepID=UPI0034087936
MSDETAAADDRSGESVSDRIAREVGRRILAGEITVGSWLRHGALALEFGTSRTPVREALRVLNAQGIVTIVQNRGARVNGHSSRDIRELGQVRSQLEGFAAELACERITDDQLARLQNSWADFRALLDDYAGADDESTRAAYGAHWVRSNAAFHGTVVAAAGNHQLVLSLEDVHRRLPANHSYTAYANNSRLLRRNLAEHEAIAQAISEHRPETARRLMTAHILAANDATVRWLEERGQVR